MENKGIDKLFEAMAEKDNFKEIINLATNYIDSKKKEKLSPVDFFLKNYDTTFTIAVTLFTFNFLYQIHVIENYVMAIIGSFCIGYLIGKK